MDVPTRNPLSGDGIIFHGRRLPEPGRVVGYGALIERFRLAVPMPRVLSLVGERHRQHETENWRVFTSRHAPEDTLRGHLRFALRYEGVDLLTLSALFDEIPDQDVADLVRAEPTGGYARRIWFLYEWLAGHRLDLPDAATGRIVDALDDRQFSIPGEMSRRHRVRNNLPGTPAFCPLVRRTDRLKEFLAEGLADKARAVVGRVSRDRIARAAAFLLLKDSKASFAIEGERPPQNRLHRWGQAVGEAGGRSLDRNEFLRLQQIVLGNARFTHMGYRTEGGFVGEHDRETQAPIPEHVSARHEDLESLIDGLAAFARRSANGGIDPVVAAACVAFGFVFIHPFEDGNGRLHRYLLHHVLAERGFNPPGIVFPISAAMLERIDDYKRALETYSAPILPFIAWEGTPSGNVRILNDTVRFYRYFDATAQVEFLYECVRRTVEKDLPEEIAYLDRYDRAKQRIQDFVEMPDRHLDLLIAFLHQGGGRLSQHARSKELAGLTDDEALAIEGIYAEAFGATA